MFQELEFKDKVRQHQWIDSKISQVLVQEQDNMEIIEYHQIGKELGFQILTVQQTYKEKLQG